MKYNFDKQLRLIAGVNDIGNKGPKQMMHSEGDPGQQITKYTVPYPQQGRTFYMTLEYSF
jgi:outer membrane receptor for ferrienterochelin and colicin